MEKKSLNLCRQCQAVLDGAQTVCNLCSKKGTGRGRKIFRWLAVFFSLSFVMATATLSCWQDGPPPKDGDLQIKIQKVEASKNAFTYFEKGTKALDLDKDTRYKLGNLSQGKDWKDEKVKKILAKNKKSLEYLRQGLKEKKSVLPIKRFSFDAKLPHILELKALGQLACIQGRYLLGQGKEKEAFEYFMDAVQYGSMVEDCGGNLIMAMIGIAIKGMGLTQLRQAAMKTKVDSKTLVSLIAKLDQWKEKSERGVVDALKAEYITQVNMIDDMLAAKIIKQRLGGLKREFAQYAIKIPYFFQPNNTKRKTARYFRLFVKAAQCDNYPQTQPHRRKFKKYIQKLGTRKEGIEGLIFMLKPNQLGRMIHSIAMPNLISTIKVKFESDFQLRATQLVLALKAYHQDQGKLPESLDALKGKYLKTIPRDPFADGDPIKYSKKEKSLSSKQLKKSSKREREIYLIKLDF